MTFEDALFRTLQTADDLLLRGQETNVDTLVEMLRACDPESHPRAAQEARPGQLNAQLNILRVEIGRRDATCIGIDSADAESGTGKYVVVGGGRRPFTWHVTSDGDVVLDTPAFAKPQDAMPEGYTPALAAIKAASATPLSTFEDRWKASRLAALAAEDAQLTVLRAAHGIPEPESELRTLDVEAYAPPDIYAAGIKALREKEGRS
jgi:hypothetical protein